MPTPAHFTCLCYLSPYQYLHYIPGLGINVGKWHLFPQGHWWVKTRVLFWARSAIQMITYIGVVQSLPSASWWMLAEGKRCQARGLGWWEGEGSAVTGTGVSALQRLGINIKEGSRTTVSAFLSPPQHTWQMTCSQGTSLPKPTQDVCVPS